MVNVWLWLIRRWILLLYFLFSGLSVTTRNVLKVDKYPKRTEISDLFLWLVRKLVFLLWIVKWWVTLINFLIFKYLFILGIKLWCINILYRIFSLVLVSESIVSKTDLKVISSFLILWNSHIILKFGIFQLLKEYKKSYIKSFAPPLHFWGYIFNVNLFLL